MENLEIKVILAVTGKLTDQLKQHLTNQTFKQFNNLAGEGDLTPNDPAFDETYVELVGVSCNLAGGLPIISANSLLNQKPQKSTIFDLSEIKYLTNGSGEIAEITYDEMLASALSFQNEDADNWYPLTARESLYIGEGWIEIGSEIAEIAYSVLHENKKWLAIEVESRFSRDVINEIEYPSKEIAYERAQAIKASFLKVSQDIGGKVGSWENSQLGGANTKWGGAFVTMLIVPFSYAFLHAEDGEAWASHVKNILHAA